MAGRVVVMTAGAGGVGRATARLFTKRGDRLVLGDIDGDKLAELVAQLRAGGATAVGVRADMGSDDGVADLFAAADRLGPVEVLVNGVGIARPGPFLEQNPVDYDRVMAVSAKSHYLCARQAALRMVRGSVYGRIVNVSSVSSTGRIARNQVLYAMAKGAVDGLTRALAYDLGPFGITVNAVAPSTIRSDQNQEVFRDRSRLSARVAHVPVGRLAAPEDVARAIVWLAEPDASYVNGTLLVVDGGSGIPMPGDAPIDMALPPRIPDWFESRGLW